MTTLELLGPVSVSTAVAAVGWLLQRSIGHIDDKLTTTAAAVEQLKLQVMGYEKLAEYQEKRIQELTDANQRLHQSVGAFDKHLAVLVATKQLPRLD